MALAQGSGELIWWPYIVAKYGLTFLFYSYWIRDKGSAMADHMGHITDPVTGKPETITSDGNLPDESPESAQRWNHWKRYLAVDSLTGICGNLLTTGIISFWEY